jgi:hypothetical protein
VSDPAPPDPPDHPSSDRQRIIRRHPTGPLPEIDESRTGYIAAEPEQQTSYLPRARPIAIGATPSAKAASATAVVTILSGWATAVIATDLITGWWASDRLFCVAVGFLTAVSAAASVAGLIALLLRRRMARLLVVVGSIVALMIFASLFVAGAKLSPVVYGIPVLPLASILFALLPATRRWARSR